MSDAELVARALDGDTDAFGELVDRHRAAVFRAALAALGSHAEADDLTQEAFVRAFGRLGSFRGEASVRTWLLTLAWNLALNRRRNLARWWRRATNGTGAAGGAGPYVDAPPEDLWRASEPTPEERLRGRQLHDAIVEEIRALKPALRDALLLSQSGEYRYDEMGAMLNVATGTIKWRVSEARRLIRRRLQDRGFLDAG